jgi:hypothetical protein
LLIPIDNILNTFGINVEEEKKMAKKIVFCLVVLLMVTSILFAKEEVEYIGNISALDFHDAFAELDDALRDMGVSKIDKLPNNVIQIINREIRRYEVKVGDFFIASYITDHLMITAAIRIINARTYDWVFYATQKRS